MSSTHNFIIESFNAPTVLPRVALLFSRRRIDIEQLEMRQIEESRRTMMGVSVRCDKDTAGTVAAQIRRIVEVCEVTVSMASVGCGAQPVRL